MAPSNTEDNRASSPSSASDADLAQAYRDLARGEQAATALEANLSNLESRLDALLAAIEANEAQATKPKSAKVNNGDADNDTEADKKTTKDSADK